MSLSCTLNTDKHILKLQTLCRLCGEKLKCNRNYLCLSFQNSIKQVFDFHVSLDKVQMHPKKFCGSCRLKMKRHEISKTKHNAFNFEEHSGNCKICFKQTFGRKPKKRSLDIAFSKESTSNEVLSSMTFDSPVSHKCNNTQASCTYAYAGSSGIPDSSCITCTTEHASTSGIPSSSCISSCSSNASNKSYAMSSVSNKSSTSTFYRVECSDKPNCSSFSLEHAISDKVPDNLFNNEDQEHCNEKNFFSVRRKLLDTGSDTSNYTSHCILDSVPLGRFQEQNLANILKCVVCLAVPKNPVYTPCSHIYCKTYIISWLNVRSSCPLCRKFLDETDLLSLSPQLSSLFDILQVKCKFGNNGCTELHNIKQIDSHEKICKFKGISPK